jgi:Arc/MetJ family transcription regulator
MKTLIDISSGALQEVQKIYQLKTKKAAIEFALNEVIRMKKLRDLADSMGTLKDNEIMSQAELKKMRKRDTSRVFSLN